MAIAIRFFDKLGLLQQKPGHTTACSGVLGVFISLVLTRKSLFLITGHLTRGFIWRTTGITVRGLVIGSAIGFSLELLRQADWVSLPVQRVPFPSAFSIETISATEVNWRLVQTLKQHGYEHQSFLSLYGGMEVWWLEESDAAVVFRRVGQVLIVVAAPLAARENWLAVTQSFLAYCRLEKLDCLMLPVGEEFAAVARQCGMRLLCVGESGYFKLPEWKPAGDRAKKIRAGVNQARKAGITVETYDPESACQPQTGAEIESLCRLWLSTREIDALGWLLELNPFKLSEHKRYFLAREANGQLCGFLACSPIYARQGWYLEDLIRHPHADRGVSELLVVEALKHLSAEGAQLATLATSPLAGVEPEDDFKMIARVLKLIYRHADMFYHFRSLHRFKSKFAPSFVEKEYVAIYPPQFKLRPILALVKAFEPGGLTGLVASKFRKTFTPPNGK
ncbi:MAG: DUF2156 domain-containing protein [Acidobacteria bacterium]|nr:DUF2156 domain-containing protein [Acidobacteriota bacterium]